MAFDIDGYFSDEAESWARRNRDKLSALFDLAERLNRHCHQIVKGIGINNSDGQQVICSALYVRALGFFQASVLMAKRGMANEAKILLRSLLEAAFTIRAVAADVEIMRRYINSDQYERLRALRKVRENPSAFRSVLAQGREDEVDTLIAELQEDPASRRTQKVPIHELAEAAGLKDTYDTAYHHFSGTVHSAVRDLEQYLEVDPKGNIRRMRWGPDGSDTGRLLITAIEGMSYSLSALERQHQLDGANHEDMLKEFDRLAAEVMGETES